MVRVSAARDARPQRDGLADLDAARAYAADPLLGARLRECTALVLAHRGRTARAIFGAPGDLKFRSCRTPFALAAPDEPLCAQALDAFFGGQPDPRTLGAGALPR